MNAPVTDVTIAAVALTLFHFLWQAVVVWAVVESLLRVAAVRRQANESSIDRRSQIGSITRTMA